MSKKKFDLSEIHVNAENPFPSISAGELEELRVKIERDPEFLELRPIVYDPESKMILGGNKRYACLVELGHEKVPESWVKSADNLSEEQKRRFIFADNYNVGAWDMDIVTEEDAEEWDISFEDPSTSGKTQKPDFNIDEYEDGGEAPDYDYPDEDIQQSRVRMVQLFMDTETEPKLRDYESELRSVFDTDNLTDTIFALVAWAYRNKEKING